MHPPDIPGRTAPPHPRSRSRRRRAFAAMAALALALAGVQALELAHPSTARASIMQVDSGVIGWNGNAYPAIAHSNGSFDVQAGKNITVGFGIYDNPSQLEWYNAGGYYPAMVTQFERDNTTVTITNFGDKVTIGGDAYVAAYSRVSVYNHDTVAHTENPAPSAQLLPLSSPSDTVQPGQTVDFDYVIATDRFGNTYPWPTNSAIEAVGSYNQAYADMTSYWDSQLAGIAQVNVPDDRLVDAYKAGYIYTNIIKSGNDLNTGGNGYHQLYDHDLIGILVNLLQEGDLSNAQAYLQTLFTTGYPDAIYKYSWPWAVYLEKTGDTSYVQANFSKIENEAHQIKADETGPDGTMAESNAIDSEGYWTVDNQSALLGLAAYQYLAEKLGNTSEANWAASQYQTLLTNVNNELNSTITANHLDYIPCAVNTPNTSNACGQTNNANWASMFLFGHWNWDGMLFGGAKSGPMASMTDSTYDSGFASLSGLPTHTYGGFPGYSTAYNAGYGEAGLASNDHRSEGIYDYEFMINNTQSAPYSWWEGIPSVGTTNWSPGTHATAGTGSSPHMWGQATASMVLLDSLASEESDGQVIVGRGVPDEWLASGRGASVSNFPISGGRMGAAITSTGSTVTLTLSGTAPSGGVAFELPAFVGNIASASTGTVDNATGVVTLPSGTTSVTVTLTGPPTYQHLGGINVTAYCTSIGDIGGASLTGSTAYGWSCVTSSGSDVPVSMDDACAWQYHYNEGAFAEAGSMSDPDSWACYVS
jgi:hypothetical protein